MWNILRTSSSVFLKTFSVRCDSTRGKAIIDQSRVPELVAQDLQERFIKGGGPGGQKVNKSSNCVQLVHKPTGLTVKVHESRLLETNRNLAKAKMARMLDNLVNDDNSVENQLKALNRKRMHKKLQKQRKRSEMKKEWKKLISGDSG